MSATCSKPSARPSAPASIAPGPSPAALAPALPPATEAADTWTKTPQPSDTATREPASATPEQTETAAPALAPTAAPTPAPTPTPLPVTTGGANLRAGPGTNYPIVGGLTAGRTVEIVASSPDGQWYEVASVGWIWGKLLSCAPAVGVAEVIPTPPPPTPVKRLNPIVVPTVWIPPTAAPQDNPPPARSCCRVCTTGKACGDSCIARNKTCHQPPGCACNG